MTLRVGLLGYGTVGKGIDEVIATHQERFVNVTGQAVEVAAILVQQNKERQTRSVASVVTTSFAEFVAQGPFDVVFEAINGIDESYEYVAHFLAEGVPVISANKKLLAIKGKALKAIACRTNTAFLYEAAVAGGVPILDTLDLQLAINETIKIEAIVNGTCNYILTKMTTDKVSFVDALAEAQELGYAEADPSSDVDGFDSLYKATLLYEKVYGEYPNPLIITRQSLRETRLEEREGAKLKYIATITRQKITIQPEYVTPLHPFYNVDGVNNAIKYHGSVVGQLLWVGPGAGSLPTASAMIEQFARIFSTTLVSETV